MADSVIKVENLTKIYRLGTINHGTLRQDMRSWWAKLWGGEDPNASETHHGSFRVGSENEYFSALKDVSCSVNEGEIFGLIGCNGAGKSTLLKILSRITAPTKGTVRIRGRLASLLEVGTGFHPELTGRENIFLNGTILGMSKSEVRGKLDAIVAFADVERFIDTPVKRYSSGMYIRLAFAVAAHLDPDILLIDEVLAVGDAQFQKKCVDKMREIVSAGKTVLFVSHNMGMVRNFCNRGIWLHNGEIQSQGPIEEVVNCYLNSCGAAVGSSGMLSVPKEMPLVFEAIELQSRRQVTNLVSMGDDLTIALRYSSTGNRNFFKIGIHILDDSSNNILVLSPNQQCPHFPECLPASGLIRCSVKEMALLPGRYYINLHFSYPYGESAYVVEKAAAFDVAENDVFGTGVIPSRIHGLIFNKADWEFCL